MKHPLVIRFERDGAALDPDRLAELVAALECAIEVQEADVQKAQLQRGKSQVWLQTLTMPEDDPLLAASKNVREDLTALYQEWDERWEQARQDLEYLCKAANIRYFAPLHNVINVVARIWAATDESLREEDFEVISDRAGVLHVRRRDPQEAATRRGMFDRLAERSALVSDFTVSFSAMSFGPAVQSALDADRAAAISRAFGVPNSMFRAMYENQPIARSGAGKTDEFASALEAEQSRRARGGPVRSDRNYIIGEVGPEFQAVVMRPGQVDSSGTIFSHEALTRFQKGMQERIESILWGGLHPHGGGISEDLRGRSPLASLRDTLDKLNRAYEHAQVEVGADLAAGVRWLGEDRAQPPRNLSKLIPIPFQGGTAYANKRGNILYVEYDRGNRGE